MQRVLAGLLVAGAILTLSLVEKVATAQGKLPPDFFGFWSFGSFVRTHAPTMIYDDRALYAFQAELGMPPDSGFPFLYPPWILLALAPFGALPYAVARIAWLALTFAAYGAAVAAWRWKRLLAALLLLAPSSAVCIAMGQNGFLSAALMLGGMRVLRTRPMLAGALLAATAYKPQLAILAPFMLLFGRHWRAMAGAGLMTAALSGAATLEFGVGIWGAWLVNMRRQAAALTAGHGEMLDKMPTVTSAALLLGGSVTLAHLAQVAGAAAGVLAIWRVRRRGDANAMAVLPLATLLATPYAFDYDLPMVTGAALAVIAARRAAVGGFRTSEFLALLACVEVPIVSWSHIGAVAAIAPVVFAGALWTMARSEVADGPAPAVLSVPSRYPAGKTPPAKPPC